jgi:hypothetical protein
VAQFQSLLREEGNNGDDYPTHGHQCSKNHPADGNRQDNLSYNRRRVILPTKNDMTPITKNKGKLTRLSQNNLANAPADLMVAFGDSIIS